MKRTIRHLAKDRQGATAIEYALVAGLFAIASITAATMFGDSADTMFQSITAAVDGAVKK